MKVEISYNRETFSNCCQAETILMQAKVETAATDTGCLPCIGQTL